MKTRVYHELIPGKYANSVGSKTVFYSLSQ